MQWRNSSKACSPVKVWVGGAIGVMTVSRSSVTLLAPQDTISASCAKASDTSVSIISGAMTSSLSTKETYEPLIASTPLLRAAERPPLRSR
ncbi:hypothetical protein BSTEL_1183 [Bifidobacterium stellenboschense]|uniref:Uncharacterized protein n=1 Tax=Bifidobacterium stellenboschense TaxID=762211 RepID=A0A087DKU9_9BIFI|nr:hypothetical protein BSTEL_1183 [Bifidobacterium stellenboschense]